MATNSKGWNPLTRNSNGFMTEPSFIKIGMMAIIISYMSISPASAALVNVALQSNGGTATAISEGTYLGISHPASYAIDGNYDTDWTSQFSMPAWVQVEFDQPYEIVRVGAEIDYHQQTFSMSVSSNGVDWTNVVPAHLSSNVPTVIPTNDSAGAAYEIFDIDPILAKYVRVDITTTTAPSSHIFQAIVGEVEAYSVVPIPASAWLFASGILALVGLQRKSQ